MSFEEAIKKTEEIAVDFQVIGNNVEYYDEDGLVVLVTTLNENVLQFNFGNLTFEVDVC